MIKRKTAVHTGNIRRSALPGQPRWALKFQLLLDRVLKGSCSERNVTKFTPKFIARCKLTFDERVVLHRGGAGGARVAEGSEPVICRKAHNLLSEGAQLEDHNLLSLKAHGLFSDGSEHVV